MPETTRTRHPDAADRLIGHLDTILKTVAGGARSATRPSPGSTVPEPDLDPAERRLAGRLMRVNHTGEVCAQALYLGQGTTSRDPATAAMMETAAAEERDHLAWCEERLTELGTRPSRLNLPFFLASFTTGALTGLMGDRINLGFVAATEDQVEQHITDHLARLPDGDDRSRAILDQMRDDEQRHGAGALTAGGLPFPAPVKALMTRVSALMTRTTFWI